LNCEYFGILGRVYTCAVARIAYAGDGEWMVAQGAERASAPCAEREGEGERERKREREKERERECVCVCDVGFYGFRGR